MSDEQNSAQILSELNNIRGNLEQFIREDSSTKRAFDTLYQELQQYKTDFLFQFEKSFLIDLLSFYDSLMWYQNMLETGGPESKENFSYLIEEFYEVLRRRDVLPTPASETLDRKRHRVIQIEDTDDPQKDKLVASVIRRGFLRGERVLREEEVALYRYKDAGETNSTHDTE